MAVYASYDIRCDLNRDRDFADANEDISAYVKDLDWTVGAVEPYTDIARANSLTLVLRNGDRRFSPQHASGLAGFEPGALVRVRVTDPTTATVYPMFIGWIDEDGIQPTAGQRGERETKVECSGFFSRLMDTPVRVGLQVNQRADQIITAVLTRAISYPPGLVAWLLGDPTLGILGETTYLSGGVSDYASLEQGVDTFDYAGDNWERGTTVYRALLDVVKSERGFLYESREGKLVFYNRHHWHADLATAVDATLTGLDILADRGLDYAYGNLVNRCLVKFHPRLVSGAGERLAAANTTLRVTAGASASTRLMYDDGSGNRIGGLDVITPVANTDWTANSAEDGSGTDLTSSVSVSMVADANGVELTFANSAGVDAFIRSLRVRGTKVTDFGEVEVETQDADSIGAYEESARILNLPLLSDAVYARNLAAYEVQAHKDPTGEARALSFYANTSAARMTYALGQGVGARLDLSELQTGLDGEYHVVGERHRVSPRGLHHVTQFLQPAPLTTVWILGVTGYTELGQTTYTGL